MISPTRNHIADSLNISMSTLQRRHDAEGGLFKEVLDETRKRLVKMYLAKKSLSSTARPDLFGYRFRG